MVDDVNKVALVRQGLEGILVAKRCALVLGIVGYSLVVWHLVFLLKPVPPTSIVREVIETVTISGWLRCDYFDGGKQWGIALLLFGPLQCLVYGGVGFLIGKTLDRYFGRRI